MTLADIVRRHSMATALAAGLALYGAGYAKETQTANAATTRQSFIDQRITDYLQKGSGIKNQYRLREEATPKRDSTRQIILHTTEGGFKGAITKIRRERSANYVVNKDGTVYAVVPQDHKAYHAGNSLWKGQRFLNSTSIGIEAVGYHNKELTREQYQALSTLVKKLQRQYSVPDENVLGHYQICIDPVPYSKIPARGRRHDGTNIDWKRLGVQHSTRDIDYEQGRVIYDGPLTTLLAERGLSPSKEAPPVQLVPYAQRIRNGVNQLIAQVHAGYDRLVSSGRQKAEKTGTAALARLRTITTPEILARHQTPEEQGPERQGSDTSGNVADILLLGIGASAAIGYAGDLHKSVRRKPTQRVYTLRRAPATEAPYTYRLVLAESMTTYNEGQSPEHPRSRSTRYYTTR